jgi:hypothetical protein
MHQSMRGGTSATWARAAMLAAGLAMQLGCGFFMAGTWDDDPKNWKRAFGTRQPTDVVVVHSRYWRSPHFTYEFQYFFETERNASLRKAFFERNALVRLADDKVTDAIAGSFGERPAWFCPKAPDRYEAWVYRDEPRGHFRVFVDKDPGRLYLTDYQV